MRERALGEVLRLWESTRWPQSGGRVFCYDRPEALTWGHFNVFPHRCAIRCRSQFLQLHQGGGGKQRREPARHPGCRDGRPVRPALAGPPAAFGAVHRPAEYRAGPQEETSIKTTRGGQVEPMSLQSGCKSGSSSPASFIAFASPSLNAFSSQFLACSSLPNWHS